MPIYKRCSSCGKRLPSGAKCSCIVKRHKEYNNLRNDKDIYKFYKTQEWEAVRQIAIKQTDGLDIYSLFILNKIEQGDTVHHIVPLKLDYSERSDLTNLIYLTESNHQLIHKLMKENQKAYNDTIELLKSLLERYIIEYK